MYNYGLLKSNKLFKNQKCITHHADMTWIIETAQKSCSSGLTFLLRFMHITLHHAIKSDCISSTIGACDDDSLTLNLLLKVR